MHLQSEASALKPQTEVETKEKKRGNRKLGSTVGSEPLRKLKLSQKHIIIKPMAKASKTKTFRTEEN